MSEDNPIMSTGQPKTNYIYNKFSVDLRKEALVLINSNLNSKVVDKCMPVQGEENVDICIQNEIDKYLEYLDNNTLLGRIHPAAVWTPLILGISIAFILSVFIIHNLVTIFYYPDIRRMYYLETIIMVFIFLGCLCVAGIMIEYIRQVGDYHRNFDETEIN